MILNLHYLHFVDTTAFSFLINGLIVTFYLNLTHFIELLTFKKIKLL